MQAPYEKDKPLLEQRCRDALAAAERGDAESLRAILADDCTFALPSGDTPSMREFLTVLTQRELRIQDTAHAAVDVRISFDGSRAQITCRSAAGEEEPEAAAWQLELTAAKQDGVWRVLAVRAEAR